MELTFNWHDYGNDVIVGDGNVMEPVKSSAKLLEQKRQYNDRKRQMMFKKKGNRAQSKL